MPVIELAATMANVGIAPNLVWRLDACCRIGDEQRTAFVTEPSHLLTVNWTNHLDLLLCDRFSMLDRYLDAVILCQKVRFVKLWDHTTQILLRGNQFL